MSVQNVDDTDKNIDEHDEKAYKDFELEQLSEEKIHEQKIIYDMKRIEWDFDIDKELKEKMIEKMIKIAKDKGEYEIVVRLHDNNASDIKQYFSTLAFLEFVEKGIFV